MSTDRTARNTAIVMYGTPWCGDCRRARRFLEVNGVQYEYVDITDAPDAVTLVERLNNGNQSVPTMLFPDGSVLTEPSNKTLATKLGLSA